MKITQGRKFRTSTPVLEVERAQRHVTEQNDRKRLLQDTRAVNNILGEMTFNTYFDGVPLERVNMALRCTGFDQLQSMLLCGREGRLHEDIGRNRWLTLTWYKMESGRYEIVAYVS